MAPVKKCTSLRADGQPCQADALPGKTVCFAHDPSMQERRKAGARKGGINKGNAARVAKQWAAAGHAISSEDLPALVRAAILDVRYGRITPSVATAIAQLARTSLQLEHDIELEARIAALEAAIERTGAH